MLISASAPAEPPHPVLANLTENPESVLQYWICIYSPNCLHVTYFSSSCIKSTLGDSQPQLKQTFEAVRRSQAVTLTPPSLNIKLIVISYNAIETKLNYYSYFWKSLRPSFRGQGKRPESRKYYCGRGTSVETRYMVVYTTFFICPTEINLKALYSTGSDVVL